MKPIEHTIPYKYGRSFKILPLFDIHYGSTLFDLKSFKRHLEQVDDSTYIFLGGDQLDSITVTDKRYSKAIDAMPGESIVDEQIEGMYDLIKEYRARIICVMHGNHENTIILKCNTNPTKRIAQMLGVNYCGMSTLMRLRFSENKSRIRRVHFYLHHGFGGSMRTEGGSLSKYAHDLMYVEADLYCYGHLHELISKKIPKSFQGPGTTHKIKERHIILCGTFKRNLTTNDETTTWEETKGFPIRTIGAPVINIKPTNEWCDIEVTT